MKTYPKMKDSGVEWIGEIPEHWEVTRLKKIQSKEPRSFIDGDWIESPFITDEGVRLIQTGNIGIGEYKEQGFRFVSEETFRKLNCTEIFPNDILICRLAEPVGRSCLSPHLNSKMITSVDVVILKPSNEVDSQFVVYCLTNPKYFDWLNSISRGSTRQRISRSMLGNVDFLLPNLLEQKQISEFLDKATSKINSELQRNLRLIEILEEKRHSLINQAVTKGLDPSIPMKDSGIEWIGKIPEHWEITKLKHRTHNILDGEHSSPEFVDLGIPYISSRHVKNKIIFDNCKFVDEKTYQRLIKRCYPEVNDVLITVKGTIGNTKRIDIKDRFVMDRNVGLIKPITEYLNSLFLEYYLNSNLVQKYIETLVDKSVISSLYLNEIKNIILIQPLIEEQQEISDFLKRETLKIDLLISKIISQNQKLVEVRQSLISSAVTGKIDVRDAVA